MKNQKKMKTKQKIAAVILVGIVSAFTPVRAQMTAMPADHLMILPGDIKWIDGPASLPPGAKSAVIEGDPKVAGLFTMRVKLPANYNVMPHFHPADEHITVIEGSFYMGVGEKFDEKAAKEIPVGGFGVMIAGTRHFALTKKGCIVQLHGMGPWGITYVNPGDDPRGKK